jgi:glycosyltransferase involved in cell wall biosynthesis
MTTTARNLALVITELNPGGAERALTQLALRIDRTKFQPFVFSLQGRPAEEQDELVRQLKEAEIPVEFLNARSKWEFPAAVLQLKRRLRALQMELVQSFLFHANVVAATAGRLAGVKVVAGIRVADPNPQRQRVERWLAPVIERYVCVSQSVADFSAEVAKLPPEKLVVIPNGVDVARFRDAAPADLATLGLPAGRRWLIAVGRLHEQKGYDWLLPLLPPVFAAHPEYDLLIVGSGPQREALFQQARELHIAPRVHFAGWQPNVPELLKAADVLLLPSRYEGMPNVILEAMATSLPVVATRVEGTFELLGPLATHQLTPPGDAAAFRTSLLAMLASRGRQIEVGAANQRRAESHFSLAVMVTAYQDLYACLMNS